MEECKIINLYNLEETIAKDLLETATYPWEVLPKISEFIIKLGKTLDESVYEKRGLSLARRGAGGAGPGTASGPA